MKAEKMVAIGLGLLLVAGGGYLAQPVGVEDVASGGTTVIPGVAVGTPIALGGLGLVGWGFGAW